jgi:1-deoxy-D-xylulose-5-phosphate reductoisomerase
MGSLRFESPDTGRFPCLDLARRAGEAGGTAPIVLNAANEVAVAALLAGKIRYIDVPRVIADSLDAVPAGKVPDLDTALDIDSKARREAAGHVARLFPGGE